MSLASIERRLQRLVRNRDESQLASTFARWSGRPADYVREHLGRGLTPKQAEILAALDKPPYRVLARSANTQGKTFVAAAKASHFFDTVRPSITLATAPTFVQVRDLFFKELRSLRPSSAGFAPKDTRLQSNWNHFVHGFTAAKADAFQGRHGERLGIIFDEATGIDPDFWSRGETMFESSGGHWWLATYNPNDSASPAYVAEETDSWALVVLNALEHPNVAAELRGEAPPIPAAVRLETILRRMAAECEAAPNPDPTEHFEFPEGSGNWWQAKTPDFEAQVLGRWPVAPTSALFSPFTVERCFALRRDVNPLWQVQIGCDVARFGDDKTTIVVRCGPCLLALEVHSRVNTTWIAQRLRDIARETFRGLGLDADASTSIPILIDDTGGYGAGVIDQANGYTFVGINASTTSVDPRYPNTRAQMWCELAALAQADALDLSRLPLNERQNVKQELTAARYTIDASGRRKLEPKSTVKERLRRSPDRADALCLAYHLSTTVDAL